MIGDNQIICALASAPGRAGISVIRISGQGSLLVARKICPFLPEQVESHHIYFGRIKSSQEKENVDEVLLSYFSEGKSYTGDESVEISCHGNPLIVEDIISALISNGARMANPGEFTLRAFLNQKIDLVQAESVLTLIESRSKQEAKWALRHLEGGLSQQIKKIEHIFLWALSHLEAEIDFSVENLKVADKKQIQEKIFESIEELKNFEQGFQQGRILKQGFRIALVGQPNSGKSSLFNCLLKEDRAIVTEIPGTTRDVVFGEKTLGGFRIEFFDTAGIRQTQDIIEKIGIEKSHQKIADADLLWLILDGTEKNWELENFLRKNIKPLWIVVNKSDLWKKTQSEDQMKKRVQETFPDFCNEIFFVSAVDAQTEKTLMQSLQEKFLSQTGNFDHALSSLRQFENVRAARECAQRAHELLTNQQGEELISLELKDALRNIHLVLGTVWDDQILDEIFSQFCIGK